MKIFKKLLVVSATLILTTTLFIFTACNPSSNNGGGSGTGSGTVGGVDGSHVEKPDDFDNLQTETSVEAAAKVDLSALKSNVSSDKATKLTDANITIDKDGVYEVEGEHTSITLAKGVTARIILNNATISNQEGASLSSDKKCDITLTLIGENQILNAGSGNAIHVKGDLKINGNGSLKVKSQSKNAIKVTKDFFFVDGVLEVESANHAVTARSIIANGGKIQVTSAKKDGLHAECDYDEPDDVADCVFTLEEGFVSLINVEYSCNVLGDGIQADTFVYIGGGKYDIKTTGEFVQDTAANRAEYDLTSDDFRYQYRAGKYQKVASDEKRGTLYALKQGCKGIKVGEIEFDADGDGEDDTVITENADYVIFIKSGTFNIDSTDDALHTNSGDTVIGGGTFTINTLDDGMHADFLLKINGGNIDVQTSYEGLEGGYVEINGGTIKVKSTDDGINAASDDRTVKEHIIISGGEVTVDAEGDGIDSNGTVLISGGVVTVFGPTTGGNGGLDADSGILVDGGTLFVTSALGMVETPGSNSKQYVVSYGSQTSFSSGDEISLKDSDGNVLIKVTLIKSCQSVIISVDGLKKGATYSLYLDDDLLETFTISKTLTTIGTQQGGFGPGGGGPRPGGRW